MSNWVELVTAFRETFGDGVRVTRLRLAAVPGHELVDLAEERAQARLPWRETYEHNMPGFGPPMEDVVSELPAGWVRKGDVPRGTSETT
jgi:hypothetical protein